MHEVAAIVAPLGIPAARLERLKTAVAEATMNAMEHGNQYRADLPVRISVCATATTLAVRIMDHGVGSSSPHEPPDLAAKLAGHQSPRGWGLHLIRHMVDAVREYHEDSDHIVELLLALQEKHDAPATI
jgi:anti-sigma regulatory factor (Ser/Thr protein kinase)